RHRRRQVFSATRGRDGFTLFEIIIVIAIIAGLGAVLIPRLAPRADSPIKKIAHQLVVLGPDVRNSARLKSRTYRIVFRMTGERHGFWVESAAGNVPPKTAIRLEEELKLPEDERPKNPFSKDTHYTKKEFEMPKNAFFGRVETPNAPDGV